MKNESMSDSKKRSLKDIFDSSVVFRVLLLTLVYVCCLFATAPRKAHDLPKLVINQISPVTLVAEFDFLAEDKIRTALIKDQVASRIPDYYQIRAEITSEILQRSRNFFEEVKKRESVQRSGQTYSPPAENNAGQWVKELSSASLNFFLRLVDNPPRMQKYEMLLKRFLEVGIIGESDFDEIVSNDKTVKIVDAQKRRSDATDSKILTPDRCAQLMVLQLMGNEQLFSDGGENKVTENIEKAIVRILEGGNIVYDKLYTDSKRQEAADQQKSIHRQIYGGSMLLQKGEVVKDEDLAVYEAYLAEKAKKQKRSVVSVMLRNNVLPCLILIFVLALYLWYLQRDLVKHNLSLYLLGVILILGMLLDRFCYDGLVLLAENTSFSYEMIYLAMPLGFSATLISVIFGIRTSLICGLFISVVAAFSCPNPFPVLLLGFLVSTGGSLAVRRTLNYKSFFLNTFWGTALGSFLMVAIFFIKEQIVLQDMFVYFKTLGVILCMGLITAMLTQMTLILLELFFDLNTTMSLMICCDYNHPLLKEMQMKAPGTYHHCLMVASLAEQAAQDSGLDPVKARACGLYHDIGKIVQPEFFIENCRMGVDMHRDMDPAMSAMIIRSHVMEHGMNLARKYKLKKILRDAIAQHHGNDLIAYFHKKAQDMAQGSHVSESDYRYPCDLPEDKEICVVMLSDCCEAASRSLDRPTPEALDELISEIFRKKIRSGQLDASKLTMRELSRIRKSFVNTLQHMYHGRIAYPKDEKQDENDLFVASGKTLQKT